MSRLIPLVCALVAVTAAAQKPRVVLVPFVAGDGATDSSVQKWNALLVEELRMRAANLDYVASPPTKAPSGAAAARATPSPEAVAALDAGKRAFDELRFEDAVATLKKGIDGVLADPSTADFELVTDGYVKMAAAQFRMGSEKAAKDTLLDLARIAPAYVMPAGFPPVFQREFEKAKKRLDKQPTGTVSIDGPAGATAFLDGRELGMVPYEEKGVSAGTHYVKVEGARNDRFGQAVTVTGGTSRVMASFGAAGPRQVVGSKVAVADPDVKAKLDEGVVARLGPYMRTAGADYALVGYVYKTSDTTLTAGSALYSAKQQAFTQLSPRTFDTEVLTANTESYRLVAEVLQRLQVFGSAASLPVNLVVVQAKAGTSTKVAKADDSPTNTENLEVSGPRKKVVLVPKAEAKPKSEVVEEDGATNLGERPPEEIKADSGVPAWVWVIVGVAVAAGAGVGIGFGVAEANKPVTGTVTASW